MAVDPSAQAILDMMEQAGGPPLNELSAVDARAVFAGMVALAGEPPEVAKSEQRDADGVPVIVTWPQGAGDGPLPIFVWIHGGGWVIGTAGEAEAIARSLANQSGCIVVNVDYRLAPEHPFPAPVDDVLAACRWAKANAADLGGDPARMAVGGDSAGGNLSAVAAQQLPGMFALQVLVYPVTDLTYSHRSYEENADGYLLTRDSMIWFGDHYLGANREHGDPKDPRVSPLFAADAVIAGLPPALVFTAEYDPLRDEGEAYAERLRAAGVAVDHTRLAGQIHGFYQMPAMIPAAAEAHARTAAALRSAFGL
jgi:acetyl esterase/lipase